MRRAIATATAVLALVAAAPAAAQEPLPPQGPAPAGANDASCRPSASKPYPVVLVHGTFANMWASWQYLSPALRQQGYCVWALDYGNNATGEIKKSARQLSTFVNQVLATTGASKVSIVGHSQGGMMPRYYVKFLGGASKVDDLIGLAPSTHGTTSPLAVPAGFFGCTACAQQAAGSPFMTELNSGDETPAPVNYTVVATRYDQVVTPYQSQALPANSRVTNVVLQDKCRLDPVEHVGIIYDPNAVAWVRNALGRSGPADPGFKPAVTCF